MTHIAYINDEFKHRNECLISIEDRGYQFSDGVYEVVYVYQCRLIDWDLHAIRLQNSLDGLNIKYDVLAKDIKSIANNLISKNNIKDGYIYLQITRGVAKRNHSFDNKSNPVLSMTIDKMPAKNQQLYENGIEAISYPDYRWKLRNLKTISLLPNILAKQNALDKGATEALLIEDDGFITEGSTSNFFIVDKENNLITHPANERILGGITRLAVIKIAKKNNLNVIEKNFTLDEAINANEAFFTSTVKHVLPASTIDNKQIGDGKCGKITAKLMKLYQNYIEVQST